MGQKQIAVTGDDTIQVAGRTLTAFGNADNSMLTFDGDIAKVAKGKNGNAIFAKDTTGEIAKLVLRILRGTDDDIFLNGLRSQQQGDFPSFVLLSGYFVKRVGDGKSNVANDAYYLADGIFTKNIDVKENLAGDTDQALSIYNISFASAARSIG